jgi:hypothetical protein
MSLWDNLPVEQLIRLAPARWRAQEQEIRELPEVEPPKEEAA